jgi:hypothetical protein
LHANWNSRNWRRKEEYKNWAIPASWIAGFSHFIIISCKLLYRLAWASVQASVQASSVANSDWRFGSLRTHQLGIVLQLECSSERICRILGLWWERDIWE